MTRQRAHLGIVVGVDGSASSTAAVEWAVRDAGTRNVPVRNWYTSCRRMQRSPDSGREAHCPDELSQWQQDRSRQIIDDAHKIALDTASQCGPVQVDSELLHSATVPTLVDLSREADMVVVGCRGEGAVAHTLLGSVSSNLVHHAHCPVAVIHDDAPPTTSTPQAPVVVGMDGSPTSGVATEIAFEEAAGRRVGLVALHAWSDMGPLDFSRPGQAPIEWANFKVREEEVLAERLADGGTGFGCRREQDRRQ